MEYLIPLLLVLLLVGGFVTFMVTNATRRGQSASRDGSSAPPGIGQDSTPLGDTAQHADEQGSREPDAGHESRQPDEGARADASRPPDDRGEREDDRRPESERLADRGF
jgi:hypothetical protein